MIPTCREMAELVTDYQEHALPLRTRFSAWIHLLCCTACVRYFAQMRQTAFLLRQGGSAVRQPSAGRPTGLQPADEEAILQRLRDQKLSSR